MECSSKKDLHLLVFSMKSTLLGAVSAACSAAWTAGLFAQSATQQAAYGHSCTFTTKLILILAAMPALTGS